MKFLLPDLTGKVALVGGATSGIGKGIAYVLAGLHADVGVLARNERLGLEVVEDLRRINPNGTYEMILCDAISMKSIQTACSDFNTKFSKLNYLVMSQGIANLNGRTETSEGIDTKMALHYYGRMNFITQLSPVLRKTAETEEVRVASVLGLLAPYINLKDLSLKDNYSLHNVASATGLYIDLAVDQLSRDFAGPTAQNISFLHVSPGGINSNWGNDFPAPLRLLVKVAQYFVGRDPQDYGKMFVEKGLLSEEFGGGGSGGSTSPASGNNVCAAQRAGWHQLTPSGTKGTVTALHTDLHREAVWTHTQEVIRKALEESC